MGRKTIKTAGPEETHGLGIKIGKALQPGIVVALIGDLGAGKTTLAKGIARGLDVESLVHSPTFTLIHEHEGRMPMYHFDLYRTERPEELDDLGYEDYFYGSGASVVEWAEKIEGLLPADRLEIRITGDGNIRLLELRSTGPASLAVLGKL